jgi:hypothetical protein
MTLALLLASPSLAQSYTTRDDPPPEETVCLAADDPTPEPDLPLTAPTYDPVYERHVQAVAHIDDLFDDNGVPQLGEGMAGLYGSNDGTIFTLEQDIDGDPTTHTQFAEHWFVQASPAVVEATAGQGFTIVADKDADQVDTTELWAGWESDAYVYMSVRYKKPELAAFAALDQNYDDSVVLAGYAFDVYENDDPDPRGHMLRERLADGTWVDFWLFEGSFALLTKIDDDGVLVTSIDVVPRAIQPANAAEFFADVGALGTFPRYARVTYRVRPGCAYTAFDKIGAFATPTDERGGGDGGITGLTTR